MNSNNIFRIWMLWNEFKFFLVYKIMHDRKLSIRMFLNKNKCHKHVNLKKSLTYEIVCFCSYYFKIDTWFRQKINVLVGKKKWTKDYIQKNY